jgi:hypothetical protein
MTSINRMTSLNLARAQNGAFRPLDRAQNGAFRLAVGALALCLGACVEAEVPPGDAGTPSGDGGSAQSGLPRVKQLVLGRAHGCSLDPDISGLLCWGDNRRGQTAAPPLIDPRFVAAGGDVSCAIAAGSVKCWGDNSRRQLAVPAGLHQPTQLAVGDSHVCALTAAGSVRCWGDDSFGQLRAPALRDVRAIGAGARHSCALAADGVHCWGDNSQRQLAVPALAAPSQLAVGGFHNCVIDAEKVACWGGSAAVLGQVPTVNAPTAIAAGSAHSCVLDAAGVFCWGDPAATSLAPRELTRVQQLAVGGGHGVAHACARHQQGIACWGDNSLGQTEYDGLPLHVLYRAEAEIAAPSALVWDVLMDLDNYGLWNPYTIAMRSTLQVGDPMIMTVKMSDLVTIEQIEHIRVLEAGHKVCWGIETTTPAFNTGERCQWLEPLPGGGTRYVTEDLIEGTANPLVLVLFGSDVERGFHGVARGLKMRAEALYTP